MTRPLRSWAIAALVVSAPLAACGDDTGSADTTAGPVPTTVTPTSVPDGPASFGRADTSIAIAAGRTFEILLDSNATTGYAWEPDIHAGASIELTGRRYVTPDTTMVGTGGSEVFTFLAARVGTTQLTFEYRRSFEPATTPAADTVTFTITVTD